MDAIQSEEFQVYIVWERILGSDDRASALRRAGEESDPRVRYFWDPDQVTGVSWRHVLNLRGLAWDTYFVFGRDSKWEEMPPKPGYWQHQGVGMDVAPFLEQSALIEEIRRLLMKK